MDQKNYNTITIPELFWKVLSRWWIIVIFAAIGAVVMYKFKVTNYDAELDAYNKQKLNYDIQMRDYNEQMEFYDEYRAAEDKDDATKADMADKLEAFCRSRLNDEQLALVNNAMDIRQLIEDTTYFQNHAILQQVDPYNIPTLYMVYQVNPENWDWIGTINQYYVNANASNDLWNSLIAEMGWGDTLNTNLLLGCCSLSYITSNQFAITINYLDTDTLVTVKNAIDRILNKKKTEIVTSTGLTHSLEIMESNIFVKADNSVASSQNTYQQWNTSYVNQLNGIFNTFNYYKPQQNLYYLLENKITGGNGYITVQNPTAPSDLELGKAPMGKTIQLAIGVVIGIILGVIFILLLMVFGTRVQRADGLEEYCELNLLGVLISNSFILPFEKLIRSLKNKKLGSMNPEKRLNLTADKIQAVIDKQVLEEMSGNENDEESIEKCVVLSGTAATKKNKELIQKLSEKLASRGIKVTYSGNLLTDSKAFSEAVKCGNVVFIEQEIKSKYERINREQLMVAGCGIKVLGAVCIL